MARDAWPADLESARGRLSSALAALAADARTRRDPAAEPIARRATEFIGVLDGNAKNDIAWIETRVNGAAVMGRSPVFVGDLLAESLFSRVHSVICTSATLATPSPRGETEDAETSASFEFLRERLGVPRDARSSSSSSRRSIFRSVRGLYVPRDVPDPQDARFDEAAAARALDLRTRDGRRRVRLVHVASIDALDVFAVSRARRKRSGVARPLLVQGERPKSLLLSQFRAAKHGVLVATMSFWEGVDVPGEALRLVVIDKIPFAVPSDPVVAARCEAVEREGMSAFYKYSVPTAAIALKQGFGRLLRSETDRARRAARSPCDHEAVRARAASKSPAGALASIDGRSARVLEARRARNVIGRRAMSEVTAVLAREILDSRGNPTIEVEVQTHPRPRPRGRSERRVDRRARSARAPRRRQEALRRQGRFASRRERESDARPVDHRARRARPSRGRQSAPRRGRHAQQSRKLGANAILGVSMAVRARGR